jgi:hypothetical protein
MTDLATIRIPVDSSEMVRAVQESRRLEQNIKLLVTALDSGTIGSKQYNQGLLQLKRQYEGLFTSTQQATARVRGFAKSLTEGMAAAKQNAEAKRQLAEATKKAETAFALANQRAKEELTLSRQRAETAWALAAQRERESAKQQADFDRLALKYNKVYAASKLYENSLNELNRAHKLNAISTQQHEVALESLNREYQQFSAGTANLSNRFVQYDSSLVASNKSANRFGLVTQQVGYQVGDFVVQVQSGTNAFVAFGQQATQLAGMLYLIPGAVGAIVGTFASILIPSITAVLAYFSRTGEQAKTFSETLQDISNDNETYQRMKESLEKALVDPMNNASQALRDYMQAREQALSGDLIQRVKGGLGEILAPSIEMLRGNEARLALGGQSAPRGALRRELEAANEYLNKINTTLALTVEGPVSELGIRLLTAMDELKRGGLLTESMREQLEQLLEETGLLEQAQEAQNAQIVEAIALDAMREEAANNLLQARIEERQEQDRLNDAARVAYGLYYQTRITSEIIAENTRAAADNFLRMRQFEGTAAGQALARYGGRGTTSGRALVANFDMTPEKQARDTRRLINATRELTDAERERLALIQSIEGSLESGFMTMIAGTKSVKDAFQAMARDIIAELYRVYVVKQIVSGITGAVFPSSLAPTSSPAPRPRPFASGGSIMPGGTYLVGEKGPEIIKPRHSGTVVPAHLSGQNGQGSTVVNNNITVSGSDAANVRMEITKMIPQITEATKAAVIDARRRGGQMRAAFV